MKSQNLLEIFQSTVEAHGSRVAFKFKEENIWISLTWDEVYKRVLDLAAGFHKLGVKKGDRVSLVSHSRYEWTLTDLAILSLGAITVPIYESSLPEQVCYILSNSESRLVVVENKNQLKKIKPNQENLPHLQQIVVIDGDEDIKEKGVYSFEEVSLLGAGEGRELFKRHLKDLQPDDHASYVYTSGTTGNPKGAIITHGNFISESEALVQLVSFSPKDESLLFLPLAHIFARVLQFTQIKMAFVQCYAESIDKLLDNITEVKPHILASVPRIFEKIHSRVLQGLESASEKKRKIFNWAVKVGEQRADCLLQGRTPSPLLSVYWALAYKLVFSKLHQKMGRRLQFFISGGAPLSKEIGRFFHSAGFLILEGYGLTETTAAVTINTKQDLRLGTVGKALPGVELKIAGDGEILVRGGMVFKGYYKRPQDTTEAINGDGWFHTGDIGEIDADGFLRITDRKKDIIVTAAGKNIAPQNIENFIKNDPYISQVMVHGDKRKFLSALVTLNKDKVVEFAKSHKIHFEKYSDLINHQKIQALVRERIEDKNKHLAKYETIKRFAILDQDFSVETGELTPTMKVKRKFTSQKYQHILDQFYQE